jgi:lysophospholipase L1-like esterase
VSRRPRKKSDFDLSLGKKIVFSAFLSALVLLLAEVVIRMTGLAEGCSTRVSATEWFVCDPILGYRVNPDRAPLGRPLNRAGFRTHPFRPKRPDVYRIVSLGDSCTFGNVGWTYVPEPYPQRLERLVAERAEGVKLEVLNAGQSGYNSFHGVMLLRTKLRGLEPDLITVRYGWNDLFAPAWPGRYREPASAIGRAVEDLLLRTSLYAFGRRLGLEVLALIRPSVEQTRDQRASLKEWRPSIARTDYEGNLRRIVEIGRARGADVWLLTSPHNPNPAEETRATLSEINSLPYEQVLEIHGAYNESTRRVGAELGVPVIDMAALYAKRRGRSFFVPHDAVHPNQAGHDLEAEVLYAQLVASATLTRPSTRVPATFPRAPDRARGRGAAALLHPRLVATREAGPPRSRSGREVPPAPPPPARARGTDR